MNELIAQRDLLEKLIEHFETPFDDYLVTVEHLKVVWFNINREIESELAAFHTREMDDMMEVAK